MTPQETNGRRAAVRHARRLDDQVRALRAMIATDSPLSDVTRQAFATRHSFDALLIRLLLLDVDPAALTPLGGTAPTPPGVSR